MMWLTISSWILPYLTGCVVSSSFIDSLMDLLKYPHTDTNKFVEMLHCHLIYSNYMFQSFAYISAYSLVIISLERYVGIVTPLKYVHICTKRNICLGVFLAWGLGFCTYFLHMIGVHYYVHIRCKLVHDWRWHFMPFIVGCLIPFLIMFWAYFQIIKALKESLANQVVSALVLESQEAKKRVIHLMLIVTITYATLYIPSQPAYMVIVNISLNTFEVSTLGILLTYLVTKIQVLLNSVVNPLIYAFKYKKFRRAIREILCRCFVNIVAPNQSLQIGGGQASISTNQQNF